MCDLTLILLYYNKMHKTDSGEMTILSAFVSDRVLITQKPETHIPKKCWLNVKLLPTKDILDKHCSS